jgi:hypothetical protein
MSIEEKGSIERRSKANTHEGSSIIEIIRHSGLRTKDNPYPEYSTQIKEVRVKRNGDLLNIHV